MIGRINRTIAIAATGALAAGGGAAYAATNATDKDERPARLAFERHGGPHGPHGLGGPPPGVHGGPPGFEAAAEYLGLSEAQLFKRLRNGNSLADIAEAEGKSVDGLVDALLAEARERIEEFVEAEPGKLGPPPLRHRHP